MTSLRKLERDRTLAELASIEALLRNMDDEDVMTRMSLEDRRGELLELVAELSAFDEPTAAAALFFGGRPVLGQYGVESEFAGHALTTFQDLVSKLLVQEFGALGQRGPVPHKTASTMHVTHIVRGSFGFRLEEVQPQGELVSTALSNAVQHASRLMSAFGDEDEEAFENAAESVDQRVLSTAGQFFSLLSESGATFRLVAGEQDHAFGQVAVERAAQRALSTSINESIENVDGLLAGVLPDGHMFELQDTTGRVIRGRVDRALSSEELQSWNVHFLNQEVTATMQVRRVFKDGSLSRENFTLVAIRIRDARPLLR